jgi:hypothetical protein
LSRPLLASLLDPVCEHPGLQGAADQTQHLPVVDPAGDSRHQRGVLDPVEEGVQVDLDRPRRAILDGLACRRDRSIGRASRPNAEGAVGESTGRTPA